MAYPLVGPSGEEFRRELLGQAETRPGPSHSGEALQTERLVVEGLNRMG